MFIRALISLLILTAAMVRAEAAPPAAEPGLVVVQRTSISGKHTIYLTDKALKIVAENGVCIYASAPSWKVSVCNDLEKKYYQVGAPQFRGEPGSRVFASHKSDLMLNGWNPICKQRLRGLQTTKHRYMNGTPTAYKLNQQFEVEHMNGVALATVWLLDDKPVLTRAQAYVLSQIYAMPPFRKLTVKLTYVDPGNVENLQVDTLSLKKQSLESKLFEPPHGYKLARSEEEVYSDKAGTEVLESCVDFLGDVEKSSKKSGRRATSSAAPGSPNQANPASKTAGH